MKFVLNSPFSSLPEYLAYYEGILPKHIFEGVSRSRSLSSFNKERPVGTGPYMIESYLSGALSSWYATPTTGSGEPKMASAMFQVVPDPMPRSPRCSPVGSTSSASRTPRCCPPEGPPEPLVRPTVENVYYFVILHQTDPRFQDVRVRQACYTPSTGRPSCTPYSRATARSPRARSPRSRSSTTSADVTSTRTTPQAKQLFADAGWTPVQRWHPAEGRPDAHDHHRPGPVRPTGSDRAAGPAVLGRHRRGREDERDGLELLPDQDLRQPRLRGHGLLVADATTPDVSPYYLSARPSRATTGPTTRTPNSTSCWRRSSRATRSTTGQRGEGHPTLRRPRASRTCTSTTRRRSLVRKSTCRA